jgi:hypothetical protein
MATPSLREQDVLFTPNRLLRDALDCIDDNAVQQDGSRGAELSLQSHRQAAQNRNGRLRTIEALRRPRK